MRVVLLNVSYGALFASPEELLDGCRSATGWAEALAELGVEVLPIQGFSSDALIEREGIEYRFVGGRHAHPLPPWSIPWRLLQAVKEAVPDVVHVGSLLYALPVKLLRHLLPNTTVLVAQHHAEQPARPWKRPVQRWGLRALDGFFFTGEKVAAPWRRADLIGSNQPIYEILEGSNWPRQLPSRVSDASPLRGRPSLFWAGSLDSNKDPMTILAGLEQLLETHPEAHLHMAYLHDELGGAVRERIASSPPLANAVTMLGKISHEEVLVKLRGADLFVQGSHREGSGYALVDALGSGAIPVVTDIPSFRFLTRGECGALWSPGDSQAFLQAMLKVLTTPLESQRRAARQIFEQRLSFRALGSQANEAYRELLAGRRQASSSSP